MLFVFVFVFFFLLPVNVEIKLITDSRNGKRHIYPLGRTFLKVPFTSIGKSRFLSYILSLCVTHQFVQIETSVLLCSDQHGPNEGIRESPHQGHLQSNFSA